MFLIPLTPVYVRSCIFLKVRWVWMQTEAPFLRGGPRDANARCTKRGEEIQSRILQTPQDHAFSIFQHEIDASFQAHFGSKQAQNPFQWQLKTENDASKSIAKQRDCFRLDGKWIGFQSLKSQVKSNWFRDLRSCISSSFGAKPTPYAIMHWISTFFYVVQVIKCFSLPLGLQPWVVPHERG